ncbi:hypothetical protein GCM10009718_25170 [Isoptericola halotolerans]
MSTTVDGGDPGEVVVPGIDGEAVVTVTNTFAAGSLEVEKVVDGEGAELWGTGPFEVSLACTFQGEAIEVPGGEARDLEPGDTVVYDGLPVDAQCVVTETGTGGATSTAVAAVTDGGEPGAVVVPGPDADLPTVVVTNTFGVGQVVVTKTLAGKGAAEHTGDVLTVELACTRDIDGEQVEIDVPGGAERELSAAGDWSAVYEDLPQGATCTLAETDAGDARSVSVTVAGETTTADPAEQVPTSQEFVVPVGEGSAVDVGVTNSWDATPGSTTPGTGVPGAGSLPRTGADLTWAWLAALMLIGTGYALVRLRRRSP